MKISEQIKFIVAHLNEYLETEGEAFACSDLVHMWQQLLNKSNGLRVLVMYAGESLRENFPGASVTGRVDRRFTVLVTRGRALTVERGTPLINSGAWGEPLYDMVENVRDMCRSFLMDPNTTERPIDYIGINLFNSEGSGQLFDAYQIEFSVGTQLALPVAVPDDYAPPVNP